MQNAKNHSRYVPLYHFILYPLILLVIIGSMLVTAFIIVSWLIDSSQIHPVLVWISVFMILLGIILFIIAWYARSFALKAQDRAIRAEENLRHFVLTGKLLDNRLTMSQIIALRFASDNEFVDLAGRAAETTMKNKDIKNAIKVWKIDNDRV